jgi:hypothetical protein
LLELVAPAAHSDFRTIRLKIGIYMLAQGFWVATFSTGIMGTFQPVLTGATMHLNESAHPVPP